MAPATDSMCSVIDPEDPDSWCSVGLASNTRCHLTVLTNEICLKNVCDLNKEETDLVTAKGGPSAVNVCLHHLKYLTYRKYHMDGCCDPLNQHEGKPKKNTTLITRAAAEALKDILDEIKPGMKLCGSCIKDLEAAYIAKNPNAERFPLLDVLESEKNAEELAFMQKCTVGLMTDTPCHQEDYVKVKAVKGILAMPPRFSQMIVSRVGRGFETICHHHERVYLEGHGNACCDPEKRHVGTVVHAQLWLVPLRFAVQFRGEQPIRAGQVVCVHCFKHIRNKYPAIDSFFLDDNRAMIQKFNLRRLMHLDDRASPSVSPTVSPSSSPRLEEESSGSQEDKGPKKRSRGPPTPQHGCDAAGAVSPSTSPRLEEESSGSQEDKGPKKRSRGPPVTNTERQLRMLRVDNPDFQEILGKLDPTSTKREMRRLSKKQESHVDPARGSWRQYTAKGVHISSNTDTCDCLSLTCPGCHFPCPKCGSPKCGQECRCNRSYLYEQMECDGAEGVVRNPLL